MISEETKKLPEVYNFCAGPCTLPRAVFEKAQAEMLNFEGTQRSIMEISHRSPEFAKLDESTREGLKEFLKIPDTHVLMIQHGGASMQFSAIVQNLIGYRPSKKAMFMTTGSWSKRCIAEARKLLTDDQIVEVTNLECTDWQKMTDPSTWNIDPEASFIHMCMNETTTGLEIAEKPFPYERFGKDVVWVGDCSSNIGTFEIDWEQFGVIYGGVHKNLGPSGAAVIIVRKDLLDYASPDTPVLSNWKENVEATPAIGCAPGYGNTPPVWTIYMMHLNVKYMLERGGLETYVREAQIKSQLLLKVIADSNGYYQMFNDETYRSRINVVLRIGS